MLFKWDGFFFFGVSIEFVLFIIVCEFMCREKNWLYVKIWCVLVWSLRWFMLFSVSGYGEVILLCILFKVVVCWCFLFMVLVFLLDIGEGNVYFICWFFSCEGWVLNFCVVVVLCFFFGINLRLNLWCRNIGVLVEFNIVYVIDLFGLGVLVKLFGF